MAEGKGQGYSKNGLFQNIYLYALSLGSISGAFFKFGIQLDPVEPRNLK